MCYHRIITGQKLVYNDILVLGLCFNGYNLGDYKLTNVIIGSHLPLIVIKADCN